MKCKETVVKLFAVFLFGIVAVNFGVWAMDSAVTHNEIEKNIFSCFPAHSLAAAPSEMILQSAASRPPSAITIRLFQLMFILFFISPPVIAVMLYLIWKELKKRNDLR